MMELNVLHLLSLAMAAVIDLAAPIVLGLFLWRRYGCRWRYWLYGLAVFFVFQVILRIPAIVFLQQHTAVKRAMEEQWFAWCFLGFAAVTAALFEEGGRWLAFRYLFRPGERGWREALMLGAGHGGLESIAVGLAVLLSLVGYIVLAFGGLHVEADVLQKARQQYAAMQGWEPLLGGWERLCALALHMAFSVMVVRSFTHGPRWWWLALCAHTGVDFASVGTLRVAKEACGSTAGMVVTELLVSVFACAALWFIVWSGRQEGPVTRAPVLGPAGPEQAVEIDEEAEGGGEAGAGTDGV